MKVRVILGPAYSWESQARQYPEIGAPGLRLEQHCVNIETGQEVFNILGVLAGPHITVIDCLLHRDESGRLDGILNHYDGRNQIEERDAINIWVRPDRQRQGIATQMVKEAMARWPGVKLENQRYTPDGVKLLSKLLELG